MNLLDTGGRTVPAEWFDYNGHLMDAYYFVAFTDATEVLPDRLGLGAACPRHGTGGKAGLYSPGAYTHADAADSQGRAAAAEPPGGPSPA